MEMACLASHVYTSVVNGYRLLPGEGLGIHRVHILWERNGYLGRYHHADVQSNSRTSFSNFGIFQTWIKFRGQKFLPRKMVVARSIP